LPFWVPDRKLLDRDFDRGLFVGRFNGADELALLVEEIDVPAILLLFLRSHDIERSSQCAADITPDRRLIATQERD
jgi:hypothetical protein